MPKFKLKSFLLILGCLTSFSLFQTKALADYDFDVISDVWSTETEDATFEFSADEDELSCSAGGGSTPSMWVGTMTGQGNTSVNDYDGTDKTDDFILEDEFADFVSPYDDKPECDSEAENKLINFSKNEFMDFPYESARYIRMNECDYSRARFVILYDTHVLLFTITSARR
mgnify:CR=1 FL=1